MRTIPNMANLLKRLDDVIAKQFIPSITGSIKCLSSSLPPSMRGLEILVFSEIADFECEKRKEKHQSRRTVQTRFLN